MNINQRVMVVDDLEGIRIFLQNHLTSLGYQVVQAGSGEEALEKVKATFPDVILLDINMPGLNGFDVLERLKVAGGTSIIPIIMMTALGSRRDREQALAAGADDFINKPFDLDELETKVRSLTGFPSSAGRNQMVNCEEDNAKL